MYDQRHQDAVHNRSRLNYIDLFSGIGGFALGAYWAEMHFENHYFSEIEPYAVELYQKRFPDAVPLGDITKHEEWKLEPGEYIITGGFPCPDISSAGKGAGITGARSGLWFVMRDVIRELRPRFAIMENVGALTFRGLTHVLGSLAEIGYDAEWQDIRASDMGAPHRRERLWIVAYPNGYPNSRGREAEGFDPERNSKPFGGRVLKPYSLCGNVRILIDLERFCRDQGYRSNDGVPETMDQRRGFGNAIVPQIAEMLFRQIKQSI